MARKIRASGLESRTARLKLPVAKKPTFVRIAPGISLGYRRNATTGSWVVRVADGQGANWTKAIGSADDYDEADGGGVLDYWQAQDRAKQVARTGKDHAVATTRPLPLDAADTGTLGAAIDRYEADLKTRGGDTGNAARVRRHLTEKMLAWPVADISLSELRKWRDNLTARKRRSPAAAAAAAGTPKDDPPGAPLAPSGVNRLCTILKAALNLAADLDGGLVSRRPWEQGLASLHGAEESRNVILTDADVRKLIAAAATEGADFALLLEGLATTGARVSQLARACVRDLQDNRPDPRIMVPTSAKGRGRKAVLHRPVPISADLAMRLRAGANGRPADGPLFPKGSGPWRDKHHTRPFARIVEAAEVKQDGTTITAYALRHSSIVRALVAGVPVRVVAALHDTSVAMIERTYSRHITEHTDSMARAAMFTP